MIVHFDGDLLVYRCGFACEDDPLAYALHTVNLTVTKALDALACSDEDLRMYISGDTNFRDGVATIKPYKGNRADARKPKHGPDIREYLVMRYDADISVDEEADDTVAYNHYAMYLEDPMSSVVCSVDKDLNMIPGMHYNFVKDESYFVSEEEGIRWFYKQLLMGDATDNIPGVPGVGPKTAEKILAPHDCEACYYDECLELYEKHYEDGAAALLENARLLWMRRKPNEWWRPPHETE